MSRFTYEVTQDVFADAPNDTGELASFIVLDVPRYVEVNTSDVPLASLRESDDPVAYLRERGALAITPIYAYCHSGVTIRAGESGNPFHDPWDSGIAGFAWTTAERCAYMGVPTDDAGDVVRAEIEEWDKWLTGDVWTFIIRDVDTGEIVDSLSGIYGYSYAEDEARAYITAHEDEETARELVAARSWWAE